MSVSEKIAKGLFCKRLASFFEIPVSQINEEYVIATKVAEGDCGCEIWMCGFVFANGIVASPVEVTCEMKSASPSIVNMVGAREYFLIKKGP
ncbi:MAG: hypothetical protein A2360_00685 [Candidatus Staskawiczbacteria bacterium RIFOXYB1_FULL_32_11]|uniref:Uncharacterized protein n=1 Tax=Candidatus Staskawiczbacteria bacterium RIFOXYD1_FULL_32_13 TaxID=1802234 RepID=A0A1G2JP82_9BACT|nr:MAG: hypothetical protein A2360_00685 [Candidatus Staskawiczbacteria bacterium RIFOXYB1_FULL_32_11]OGZ87348.1 MAG: hypothetical protein A2463_01205 [Candidatus Staskawiczbacteria bacterium RIFOXYC2_FULL_32_10]OGZ88261.1 MAG: hypothetical protein A2561_04880 [Candidatus Staskawiczbacteria bacterium RIFOXYD1_FULL_32_13]